MLKRITVLLALLLAPAVALAQSGGSTTRPTWFDGSVQYYVSTAHPMPVTGTFSATLSGFAPATTGTPISVTTGGVTGTLPAGAVVVASNIGATNNAYCKLGASATTSDQLIAPTSWFAFTVGVATQLTCITSTSTTTVNMVGGAGLPTGAGGGGGGGGSSAITTWGGGTLGAMANYGTSPGAVLVPGMNSFVTNTVTVTGAGGTFPVTQSTSPWITAGGGTAGSAATGVSTIQGIASMTPVQVSQATAASLNATVVGTGTFVTQSTLAVETTKVIGTIRIVGNVGGVLDAIGQNVAAPANWLQAGCQFQTSPTTITATNGSPLQCNNGGKLLTSDTVAQGSLATIATLAAAPLPAQTTNAVNIGAVMNAGSGYETIAAGVTGQAMGASGATGDYLSHCVLYPVTVSPGVVTVFDSTSSTTNNVITFAGGTSSLSNLAPISIPVGAISVNGAWKVTTGSNVLVNCYGKFT